METLIVDSRFTGTRAAAVKSALLAPDEVGEWINKTVGEIAQYLATTGNEAVGPPFVRCEEREDGSLLVEGGVPVAFHIQASRDIFPAVLPGGAVATTTVVGDGPWSHAKEALRTWISSRDAVPDGEPWAVYQITPTDDPAIRRVEIVQPYHHL